MIVSPGYDAVWRQAYGQLAESLPELARAARPLLTGFAACVDKLVDLHELAPRLAQATDRRARNFLAELLARAAAGRGGEILVDWPEGPGFLDACVHSGASAVGGTSAQAAWTLARIGAPAVIALADRNAAQLAVLDPAIRVAAEYGRAIAIGDVAASGTGKPAHYIVEYTQGRPLPGMTPTRSTRIIVRFADEDIEYDPLFRAFSREEAGGSGAALLSSPNGVAAGRLPAALDELAEAAADWRKAAVAVIHLELGEYTVPGARDATLAKLSGEITSLGLSLSELRDLIPGRQRPEDQAIALAERLGLSRLAVHADHWALAVTRHDPERECDALAFGCFLASARASAGQPLTAPAVPRAATFAATPVPEVIARHSGGWTAVSCPAPHLCYPRSTVGLGDSFTAGTMLIHSQGNDRPILSALLPGLTTTMQRS